MFITTYNLTVVFIYGRISCVGAWKRKQLLLQQMFPNLPSKDLQMLLSLGTRVSTNIKEVYLMLSGIIPANMSIVYFSRFKIWNISWYPVPSQDCRYYYTITFNSLVWNNISILLENERKEPHLHSKFEAQFYWKILVYSHMLCLVSSFVYHLYNHYASKVELSLTPGSSVISKLVGLNKPTRQQYIGLNKQPTSH